MALILPYLLLFFVFFLMANFDIWDVKLNKPSRRGVYLFALVLLVFFAGCRWFNVPLSSAPGIWQIFDYSAYEYAYDNPLSLNNFSEEYSNADVYINSMDRGYVFISSFFSNYIFSDANLFFLLLSLFTVVLFAKGLKRNHIKHGVFIVLFAFLARLYFQYNFIMMRQALSMAIVWWAIPFVHEKRFWKFALFCFLGGMFHFTAFLFIIVYFFPKFTFSNKFLIYAISFLVVLSVSGVIDKILLVILEQGLIVIGLGDKAIAYVGNEVYSRGINPLNFLEMLPFLYFALKYREQMYMSPQGKLFFNMAIFYMFFMIITMNFMALTRISSYYLYSFFFIISFVFKQINIYGNRVIYGYLFIIYFFIYGIRFIHANFSTLGYHLFFLN